ncbi:hypothetical protein C8Q79DRAFT_223002 [Trametes meyenii]|nr:hypothetical protein C8Q79DRAFT_223002 [Trametes meyenii]
MKRAALLQHRLGAAQKYCCSSQGPKMCCRRHRGVTTKKSLATPGFDPGTSGL